MSSAEDNLPFPRGTTALANCGTLTSTMADQLEGREYEVLDWNRSANPATLRSHRKVRLRVVRNMSGVALLPKQLVVLARDAAANISGASATAGVSGITQVVGVQRLPNIKSYAVDEWLPAAGVPDKDLFYIVLSGPAVIKTRNTDYSADIAVGDIIPGAATAATSAATNGLSTGGKADAPLSLANTDLTASHLINVLGRALSTRLTTATNSDLLVEVGGFIWG